MVYTDRNASLEYLIDNELGASLESKLRRWALRLMEFRQVTHHIAGQFNDLPDWLLLSYPKDSDWVLSEIFVLPSHPQATSLSNSHVRMRCKSLNVKKRATSRPTSSCAAMGQPTTKNFEG